MLNAAYFSRNRSRFYEQMKPGSLLILFSGEEIRRTVDEFYPFFAERNFVYMTGLCCKQAVLLAEKDNSSAVREQLYILPPDFMAERWTGRRVKPYEAEAVSGIRDVRFVDAFDGDVKKLLSSGHFGQVYLDCYRQLPTDIAKPAHGFAEGLRTGNPEIGIMDASCILRRLRTIKSPEEIFALREAEKKTKAGILAMMEASRPGMYEYQ